jgi:hypothetical protein
MHHRLLIDSTGVWCAQSEEQLEHLTQYCRWMSQDAKRRCPSGYPYNPIVVQVATSDFSPARPEPLEFSAARVHASFHRFSAASTPEPQPFEAAHEAMVLPVEAGMFHPAAGMMTPPPQYSASMGMSPPPYRAT